MEKIFAGVEKFFNRSKRFRCGRKMLATGEKFFIAREKLKNNSE